MPNRDRISWKEHNNAVEIGFEHYLDLIERRIRGDNFSLVQEIQDFFKSELGIELRKTQVRGLMHRSSSIFIDYVQNITGEPFNPTSQYWVNHGLDGFLKWRAKWDHLKRQEAIDLVMEEEILSPPMKKTFSITRIVRDNALSRFLKSVYDGHCQICKRTFTLPSGRNYAEAHHIQPLGWHHRGYDIEQNMLILCPLHHAMYDYGVIALHPDKREIVSIDENIDEIGKGLSIQKHNLGYEFLEYHYEEIYGKL